MRSKLFSILSTVAITGVALLSCLSLTGCGTKTVDLSKYVTVTFDGYDTVGTASATFDSDKFEKDFKDIKVKKANEEVQFAQRFGETALDIFEGCFSGSLDKYSELSNGDKVTYNFKIDEQTLACFGGVKVKSTSIPFTVKGLKEVDKFNPFDDITVAFGGDNNDRQVVINHPETDIWNALNVSYTRKDNTSYSVKAGEEITVTVTYGNPTTLIEKYNKLPSVTEKTFTVSSFAEYPSTLNAVGDKAIESLKKQGMEKAKADLEGNNMFSNVKVEYVGNILQTSKSGYPESVGWFSSIVNRYFVVLKVSVDVKSNNISYGTVEAYQVIGWDDIEKDNNGEVYAGYASNYGYGISNNTPNYPWGAGVTGYKTLEEIDKLVANDKFDVEKNY